MPLDPFFVSLLQTLELAGWPGLSAGTPEQARALVAAGRPALGDGPALPDISTVKIPTRSGDIPARLYRPAGETGGLTIFLHGGGWVVGTLDDYDTLARELAARSRTAVLMPDYRLAPEFPFPAGLEDCEDAVLWARQAAPRLGLPGPLVIAGDSAGGNLATVIARRLRGRVPLAMQVLVYPATDTTTDRESFRTMGHSLPLKVRDMTWFLELYAAGHDWTDPDIAPIRAPDLSRLPRAFIVTAEFDMLHDEGVAYAERLRQAGVPVILRDVPGVIHDFLRLHNVLEAADEMVGEIAAMILAAVSAPRPG